jgi:hypothetical protein
MIECASWTARLAYSATAAEAANNILYNILGGLLTVPSYALVCWMWRRWRNRKFKTVFGPGTKSFSLCYGSLIPRPEDTPSTRDVRASFRFAKPSFPGLTYSASHVASGSEIRGSAYLAGALRVGGWETTVADDELLKDRLDLDFISLGYANNLKTQDLVKNDANSFAVYSYDQGAFVTKRSQLRIFSPAEGHDYGIIMRIHPSQFPDRTWICCAGLGEWGTSGSAWFLAQKWQELASRLTDDQPFLAVVTVTTEQDESATLANLFTQPEQLEQFVNRSSGRSDNS